MFDIGTHPAGLIGDSLKEFVYMEKKRDRFLAESLINEHACVMFVAPPGTGKSVMVAVMLAQMSSGIPLFGLLDVARPIKCYYMPHERDKSEICDRLKLISEVVPINWDNIYIDDTFRGINLLKEDQQDFLIKVVERNFKGLDMIITDPIYKTISGGLSKDEQASIFCSFSTKLMTQLGCTHVLIHHTNRGIVDQASGKRMDGDTYGSQWLQAHATGIYLVSKTAEGISLQNKKDSHSNLLNRIELDYTAEHYMLAANSVHARATVRDRALLHIRLSNKKGHKPGFEELRNVTGASIRALRDAISQLNGSLIRHQEKAGSQIFYEIA